MSRPQSHSAHHSTNVRSSCYAWFVNVRGLLLALVWRDKPDRWDEAKHYTRYSVTTLMALTSFDSYKNFGNDYVNSPSPTGVMLMTNVRALGLFILSTGGCLVRAYMIE